MKHKYPPKCNHTHRITHITTKHTHAHTNTRTTALANPRHSQPQNISHHTLHHRPSMCWPID
jgi:hypothetical protein